MAARKTIKLSEPFEWHGRSIDSVDMKEPTGWQVATLGEPRVLVHNASIGGYFVELPDVISKYLERCVEHEMGADVVKLLTMTDALKLKAALFDFFSESEAKIANEKLQSFASARKDSPSAKLNS